MARTMARRTTAQHAPKLQTELDRRWAAVAGRDPRFDGKFVYGVRTSGIYCRPVCPSRLPNRQNVTFYATCDEAEQAGFRACKRCRPR